MDSQANEDVCQLCLRPIVAGEEIVENDEGVQVHRHCYEDTSTD